jgi:nucleotide-binding universal stress UspA family protein
MNVNSVPDNLGNNLLVAMDNAASSLYMVRVLARLLPDHKRIRITLMHYLAPIYWEHAGIDSPEDEEALENEEEWVEAEEEKEELETDFYFKQATAILERAGVPSRAIRTRLHFDENSVSEAVLTELQDGLYTSVVMGRQHHDLLAGMLGGPVTDVLRQHDEDIAVWVIEDEPEE